MLFLCFMELLQLLIWHHPASGKMGRHSGTLTILSDFRTCDLKSSVNMVGKRQTWTVCLSVRTKTFYCSTKRSKEKSKTTWFLPEKSSEKTQATQLDNLRLQPTSQRSCSITSRRASEIVDKARQFCCLGLHVSTEFASWHLLHPVERKHKPPIINYMAIRMLFCGVPDVYL